MRPRLCFLFLAGLLAFPPLTLESQPAPAKTRAYWPTHGWRWAASAAVGIDGRALETLHDTLEKEGILTMLVVRQGFLVESWYAPGYNEQSLFSLHSCTKSVTSALVGIALDRGLLQDLDQPLTDFYPNEAQRGITLRHLLAMTSGLDWPEWSDWDFGIAPMWQSPDWIRFVLSRAQARPPGEAFNYNTGGSQILSGILQQATGVSAEEFARLELFSALGIEQIEWWRDPQGVSCGGFGLRMSAPDAAKFAFLFLNRGVWEGRRILSSAWIEESTRRHSEGHPWFGAYGLHWWLRPGMFYAMGYAGQYLFVIPAEDLVVVFFSNLPRERSLLPLELLDKGILPALRASP